MHNLIVTIKHLKELLCGNRTIPRVSRKNDVDAYIKEIQILYAFEKDI